LEAWACWELLRRLGFRSDDIDWEFANTLNVIPAPGLTLNIVLRTQGLVFTVTCSHRLSETEAQKLRDDSVEFQTKIVAGTFSEAEMTTVLHGSHVWARKVGLVAALGQKGILVPSTDLNLN
jgi:hypothetical protein